MCIRDRNEHLEKFLEPVEPYEFYREIFPEGSFERKGHFEAVSYTHLDVYKRQILRTGRETGSR